MQRKEYVIDLVATLVSDRITAEMVVERLQEEGFLHLGYGNAEVDAVIEKFKDTFGTTKTTKYDRFAASRLAHKYGSQAVVGIIDLLGKLSHEKYAPVPRSVADLEEKWSSVLAFLRKQGQGTEEIDLG